MAFLKLDRKFFDHFLWKEKRKFSRAEAWLDLIQLVSYSDGKSQIINGVLVKWNRGQHPVSLSFLSRRWDWSINKVRTYLNTLETTGQATYQTTNVGTMITLCNYDIYNPEPQAEGQAEGIAEGQADGTRTDKNLINKKNSIKERKEINIPFEDFWNLYDKKIGRKKCEAKWTRLAPKEREDCMRYLPAYIDSTPEIQYRKNPETFLNNNSWEDELPRNGKNGTNGKPKTELRRIYEESHLMDDNELEAIRQRAARKFNQVN